MSKNKKKTKTKTNIKYSIVKKVCGVLLIVAGLMCAFWYDIVILIIPGIGLPLEAVLMIIGALLWNSSFD